MKKATRRKRREEDTLVANTTFRRLEVRSFYEQTFKTKFKTTGINEISDFKQLILGKQFFAVAGASCVSRRRKPPPSYKLFIKFKSNFFT